MNTKKEKIGVGITTYNSESYFKSLYNSLPKEYIDELVVVNGGKEYKDTYDCDEWIQHTVNKFPSVCRNECIKYLLSKGCTHIFIIEDDMIILDKNIFHKYIESSEKSGLKYLCYVSTSDGSGKRGQRTPKTIVEYPDTKIAFYDNMCNEFTYHHKSVYEKVGLYDENLRDAFDVDMAYRESMHNHSSIFWWFADIINSDDYIMNNPEASSRLQADRPDGSRQQIIGKIWEYFKEKHGVSVWQIEKQGINSLRNKLKEVFINK